MNRVLVADPPWRFEDGIGARGAESNYPLLSLADIAAFPQPPMLPDCVLFLWRVSSMVEEAYQVCRAWGFVPKSEMVWRKLTSKGNRHIGMGRILRGEHETCIVATRGKVNPLVKDHGVRTVFDAEIPAWFFEAGFSGHSAKPDEFYANVEKLFDGPYVELFARRTRSGWDCYGNELDRPHPVPASIGAEIAHLEEKYAINAALSASHIEEIPMRMVIKNGGYFLTGENGGWGQLSCARECTAADIKRINVNYPQAELIGIGSAYEDPWEAARARVADVERDVDESDAQFYVLSKLGITDDMPALAAPPETKPKKRGRRANQIIFSDIANGLRSLQEPIEVSLVSIAKWSSAERKEVEDWLADREGPMPAFVTRDAMKPGQNANAAPRAVTVPKTIVAPEPTGPMADRNPTFAEWIAQAVKESLVDPADVCLMNDHEAYCHVLSRAPAGWFARARVLILSEPAPPPMDLATANAELAAFMSPTNPRRAWDIAARMADVYAEVES